MQSHDAPIALATSEQCTSVFRSSFVSSSLVPGAHLQCGAGQGARALEMAFLLWNRLLIENSLDVFGRKKEEADYCSLKLNCFVVWE